MRKSPLIFFGIAFLIVAVFIGRIYSTESASVDTETVDNQIEYDKDKDNAGDDDVKTNSSSAPIIKVDTNPNSYTVLVNRSYSMPADYVPADLTMPNVQYSYYGTYEKSYMREIAARSIEKLFKAAQKKGYTLKVVSAYRSYKRQEAIYNNNVNTRGEKDTNKVSAKPGCSEHQTGLAIDVSSDTVNCTIEASFGSTPEGKWLAKNCHRFGFIIRYPKGKADITGYSYEPWHIRYVGRNLARRLYRKHLTLEEYYMTTTVDKKVPKDSQITDSDSGKNIPKEPEVTTAPTPDTTAYMNTPTPKPEVTNTDTPEPQVTRKPVVEKTKNPVVVTPRPSAEPTPVKTPKPTKKPVVTKKPAATKKPVVEKTKKPVVTPEPVEDTPKPVETETPQEDGDLEE